MKEFETVEELIEFINLENANYRGCNFESYNDFEGSAKEHFNDITEEYEDREEYYSEFGLEVGDCTISKGKSSEEYYVNEMKSVVRVDYYESYIDSAVPSEDYFYGFYTTKL